MNKLTSSQVERIQEATEETLSGVGVRVDHDGILKSTRAERLIAGYTCPVPEQIQEDLRAYFRGEYHKLGDRATR